MPRYARTVTMLLLATSAAKGATYSVLTIGSTSDFAASIDSTSGLYLNNLGEVAGTFHGSINGGNTGDHGFRTQPNSALNPVADDIGQFQQPQPSDLHPTFSTVGGLNNLGQVLAGANDTLGLQPALTDSSGKINSSTLKFTNVFPVSVNDGDQVAGNVNGSLSQFRTQPNNPNYNPATDNLATPDDPLRLYALNNSGQLLGLDTKTGLYFLSAPAAPINLASDSLSPGVGGTSLNDSGRFSFGHINNSGVVVFDASTSVPGFTAFISENGQTTDLNTLIDPSLGLYLTNAEQINDNGQILALARATNASSDSPTSVVLLTPTGVPEPTSLTLLGASSLLLRRRRALAASAK